MEIWKDVPGYEGLYQVNNLGIIKSIKNNKVRIRKPQIDTWKYYKLDLWKNSKMKQMQIHKIVFISFNFNPPKNMVINHIDGNKLNNNLSNLELITQRENVSHGEIYNNKNKNIGVCFYKPNNKYRAHIYIDKKLKHLGYFNTIDEAIFARKSFEIENNIINKYS
jgi:hypothetical protein